jgi:hypothetical protein
MYLLRILNLPVICVIVNGASLVWFFGFSSAIHLLSRFAARQTKTPVSGAHVHVMERLILALRVVIGQACVTAAAFQGIDIGLVAGS